MEGSLKNHARSAILDRPKGFVANVPKIFLNTTSKDQICLLPEQYKHHARLPEKCTGNLQCANACSSCSLPDLACDPEVLLTRPRKICSENTSGGKCALEGYENKRKGSMSGNLGDPGVIHAGQASNNNGTKLSVYCSPRVSRREFAPPCVQSENHKPGEFSWLHNAEVAKFIKSEMNRRESNSSVESDSSLRSASHMSTCATSEYTHFTSCDRLSLPVQDLSSPSGNFPCSLGRLRRIYSNPEAPFLKESKSVGGESQMRDSKSCSDLENQSKPLVNHLALERRLSNEAGHLLSPPSLFPRSGGTQHVINQTAESLSLPPEGTTNSQPGLGALGGLGSPPPVEGWEEKTVLGSGFKIPKGYKDGTSASSRDHMIRQWLQDVDPAIVVSNEYTGGGGSQGLDRGGTASAPVANV